MKRKKELRFAGLIQSGRTAERAAIKHVWGKTMNFLESDVSTFVVWVGVESKRETFSLPLDVTVRELLHHQTKTDAISAFRIYRNIILIHSSSRDRSSRFKMVLPASAC